MLRLTLDKSPAVKPDATVYSPEDNVKLNSTRRGKRSKVGILVLEVSEGGDVCFLLAILLSFSVEETKTMIGRKGLRTRVRLHSWSVLKAYCSGKQSGKEK